MPRSRQRPSRAQVASEPKPVNNVTGPGIEEPVVAQEHVSDPHGTVAMLLMLLLMLLLVFLVFAIAQSV